MPGGFRPHDMIAYQMASGRIINPQIFNVDENN